MISCLVGPLLTTRLLISPSFSFLSPFVVSSVFVSVIFQVNKEVVRQWGGVSNQGGAWGVARFLCKEARQPTVWSVLISWRAIDRSCTPNGILNKSKYDSQMLKREEKKKKITHPPISKTQRQSPWKYYSERQISALVFSLVIELGGWEEEQNVRYHYTALEWHDEKQQNRPRSQKSAASIRGRQKSKCALKQFKKKKIVIKFSVCSVYPVQGSLWVVNITFTKKVCFGLVEESKRYPFRSNSLTLFFFFFLFFTVLYLHKSCPNMTHLKVPWELEAVLAFSS